MSRPLLLFIGLFISIVVFFGAQAYAESPSVLTIAQESWLAKSGRTISVHPQKSYAPFVFVGSGTVKKIKGLSADFIEAIAKHIDVKVVYTDASSFSEIVQETKEGANDVVLSLSPTDDLGQYFYFTDSYITMPTVIVVRKDYKERKSVTSLNDFNGKKVAIASHYPVETYTRVNYPQVMVEPVADDEVGLQKLLLGEVDAAVMDLASLSYYTNNDILSYVKAVGRTGFEYKHSIAVPKTSPELLLILDAGLKSLSDAEKQVIINKWISIDTVGKEVDLSATSSDHTPEPKTLATWLLFAGFVILIIATVITVVTVRKAQFKAFFSHRAKKEAISDVQDELKELQMVHETLKEEMQHVEALEEDIEKKMHSVE